MINLLQEKFEEVEKLKTYTKQILHLSPKSDYEKIKVMIEIRQKYMEKINSINEKIENLNTSNINSYEKSMDESLIFKKIKEDIRKAIEQIIEMDKEIRKNINEELRSDKEFYNQPKQISKLNLKA